MEIWVLTFILAEGMHTMDGYKKEQECVEAAKPISKKYNERRIPHLWVCGRMEPEVIVYKRVMR